MLHGHLGYLCQETPTVVHIIATEDHPYLLLIKVHRYVLGLLKGHTTHYEHYNIGGLILWVDLIGVAGEVRRW